MAAIGTIRKYTGFLVFIIALAMISFLLMDAFSSRSNIFSGRDNNVGEVNGHDISYPEFEQRYRQVTQDYQLSNPQAEIDEAVNVNLREQAWAQIVQDYTLGNTCNEIGIEVTPDELFDMVQGKNPHPSVVQAFQNPENGQFDANSVIRFLKNLDNAPDPETKLRWMSFERFLKNDRLISKYSTLVGQGLYVPQWQAEMDYYDRNRNVNISFVTIPYSTISDSDITVTDADLLAYIKENEKKYEQEESRTIEFVAFDVNPSKEDTANITKYMAEIKDQFKKADNDSIFVRLNSDERFDNAYYKRDQLTNSIKDTLFGMDSAQVYGPYLEEGAYRMAKLVDRKMIPDSVKARQIKINVTTMQQYNDGMQLLDSLKTLLEEGKADFAALAQEHSQDEATKFNGGDIGWVEPGILDPLIDKRLFFYTKKGDFTIVASATGLHLIEVQEAGQDAEAVKVAYVVRNLAPSSKTNRMVYAKANEFASKSRTPEAFKQQAEAEGLSITEAGNLKKNGYQVLQMRSRELVKWAYDAELDEISRVIGIGDQYVIAHLSKIYEKGKVDLENVRFQVEVEVKKQKKAALIKNKISSGATLESIASTFNQTVKKATDINFSNPFAPGIGSEPKVVATAVGLAQGAMSDPVAANSGVYIIQCNEVNEPAPKTDYTTEKRSIKQSHSLLVQSSLYEAVKNSADIDDRRNTFY